MRKNWVRQRGTQGAAPKSNSLLRNFIAVSDRGGVAPCVETTCTATNGRRPCLRQEHACSSQNVEFRQGAIDGRDGGGSGSGTEA